MDSASRLASDEFGYLREILHDDELARQVAEADTRNAAALVLEEGLTLVAIMLWRNRTGDDLRTSVDAVTAIKTSMAGSGDISSI